LGFVWRCYEDDDEGEKEVREEDEEIERKNLVDNGALLDIMDIQNSMAIFSR
jgi:hypothetical protein